MSEVVAFAHEPGVTFQIKWIILDAQACSRCQLLGHYPFTERDLEGSWLVHPDFGPVWDLALEQSFVHPNCRCTLDVQVDVDPEQFKGEGMMVSIRELKEEIDSLKMSYHELRELETILMRTLIILEQSTGSKEIQAAINNIQRLITIVRMAQFTIHAFYAASGPIGWAFALSGLAVTGITAYTSLYDATRGMPAL